MSLVWNERGLQHWQQLRVAQIGSTEAVTAPLRKLTGPQPDDGFVTEPVTNRAKSVAYSGAFCERPSPSFRLPFRPIPIPSRMHA